MNSRSGLELCDKRPSRLMESGPLGWVLTRLQPLLLLSLQVLLVSWSTVLVVSTLAIALSTFAELGLTVVTHFVPS